MDKPDENSVKILWNSFLKGDDKSFAIIYQYYIDGLLSYGYKLSLDKEMVHDAIQEIFIDLFLKRKKLGIKIENLKSYLFVALRHNLVKKIKKNKKFETQGFDAQELDSPFYIEYKLNDTLTDLEISNEIKDKLSAAIKKLPPRQTEIIYLKFEEELGYKEISEILRISVESARKLLYRSLVSLREVVDKKTFRIFYISFFKKKSIPVSMF